MRFENSILFVTNTARALICEKELVSMAWLLVLTIVAGPVSGFAAWTTEPNTSPVVCEDTIGGTCTVDLLPTFDQNLADLTVLLRDTFGEMPERCRISRGKLATYKISYVSFVKTDSKYFNFCQFLCYCQFCRQTVSSAARPSFCCHFCRFGQFCQMLVPSFLSVLLAL